jgi:hypothetical protein
MIASDFNGAINEGRQKDFRPDHAIPFGTAIHCNSGDGDTGKSVSEAVSIIDLSHTEYIVDESNNKWNTFVGRSGVISSMNTVIPSTEWPHWHYVTITSSASASAGAASNGACTINAPISNDDANNSGINAWNGNYLIRLVRHTPAPTATQTLCQVAVCSNSLSPYRRCCVCPCVVAYQYRY